MTTLVVIDDRGNGVAVDVDKVAGGFGGLLERFDADPVTGVDLVEAAPTAITAQMIGAGYNRALCLALAQGVARVLARYPALSSEVMDNLDRHIERLAGEESGRFPASVSDLAQALVQAAFFADSAAVELACDAIATVHDPMTELEILKSTFLRCCIVIAVAKGR